MATIILSIGLAIFLAHFLVVLFEKTMIPDVLILMLVGILVGPVFHIISPADLGKLGNVFATLALIVILFDAGTELSIKSLEKSLKETVSVTLGTFVLSAVLISLLVYFFFWGNPLVAILCGVILAGTSSAVVVPMISGLKIGDVPKTVLTMESALTDVLCVVLTIGIFNAIKEGQVAPGEIIGQILASFVVAAFLGAVGAFLWSLILRTVRRFPDNLFTTFAFIFILYGITEFLGYSGAIASLAFGLTVVNIRHISFLKKYSYKASEFSKTEKMTFSAGAFLLKTFFFLYIGISMNITDIPSILMGLMITIVIYSGRLVVIRYLMPESTSIRDATIMSVIVPKGLAAAVLAALLPLQGISGSEPAQNIVYAVIFWSIFASASLIFLVEKTPLDRLYARAFAGFQENVENQFDNRK